MDGIKSSTVGGLVWTVGENDLPPCNAVFLHIQINDRRGKNFLMRKRTFLIQTE